MKQIPKIIHQIWGGNKPLPSYFEELSNSWKKLHPEWEYKLWNDYDIDCLVVKKYPQYYDQFESFTYNMQRWDTVRYMILYTYGGIYADFDTECLKPIDELIENKECFFSLEPFESAHINNKDIQLSTAIMGSIKGCDFMNKVLFDIFDNFKKLEFTDVHQKVMDVVSSTGPLMLTNVFEKYSNKDLISIIPHSHLAFFHHHETMRYISNHLSDDEVEVLEKKLKDAYAVHYYFYDWFTGDNIEK